jgi:hypothetical protein
MKQFPTNAILPSDVLPVTHPPFSKKTPLYCTATETTLSNIVLEKNLFLIIKPTRSTNFLNLFLE